MGHSENRGRRGLTLPLSPRAKLIGLSILIAGLASLIMSAQLDPVTARVERVIDGDTIRVRHQGNSYTVRLIGVDTPETKHPTQAVEHFGREASAFTKAALEGKLVALVKDRTGDTIDRYGRLLRYVHLDGDNFNARLIRRATPTPTGASPSRSERSLFNWKNKRGGEASAYGTAARIAGLPTRPTTAGYTSGRATCRTNAPRSIDPQSPAVPDGDNLRAVRQILHRAQRRSGTGYAMFPRSLSPGPVWADASPAPERFARLRRLSPGLAFVVPAHHRRGRRFPTASGFGRFPPFAGERKTLTNP